MDADETNGMWDGIGSSSLRELLTLLHEQKRVLETLLELSREERQVIVDGEAGKLENIVRLELRELSKLGAIEKKRAALHKTISVEFNLPEGDVTVSAIAERAEPKGRENIKKLQTELTDLIGKHTTMNMENRELIKAHLEYSEAMLELMVDTEDPLNNFYGGDGKAAPERKRTTGFFDSHA
jgi:flagellar biosynthesis/type III secretory pathway chaperone